LLACLCEEVVLSPVIFFTSCLPMVSGILGPEAERSFAGGVR